MQNKTSWGNVADWYDDLLNKSLNNYQKDVILPNILRLLDPKKNEKILDVACGQGFFSKEISKSGAEVFASDISNELIEIAKKNPQTNKQIKYFNSKADKLDFLQNKSLDKSIFILAVQNIDNLPNVWIELNRVLKTGGELHIVLNHPSFRIPKNSFWYFDENRKKQGRLIESYMSENKEKIDMTPGEKINEHKKFTLSFHRPLQWYFKTLENAGFYFTRLEEWISNKQSQKGPRQIEEDRIRKEIPMFLYIKAIKR